MTRRTVCVGVDLSKRQQREGKPVVRAGETYVAQQWGHHHVLLVLSIETTHIHHRDYTRT